MRIEKCLVMLTILLALPLPAQVQLTYQQLRQYEGIYDYENNLKLTIAASPKDFLLYAIIAGAKYPLRPQGRDIFLNNQDKQVIFVRNERGEVIGYKQEGGPSEFVHKRLETTIAIPENAWYARADAKSGRYEYHYSLPENRDDGLLVGSITATELSPKLLTAMVAKVVDETYADVHSILIVKDGKLVFEEYFYEYDVNTPHQLRSATKSFISALVGIAIDKGFIKSNEEKILPYFKEYQSFDNPSEEKSSIRIVDLLTQQSGLDCNDWNWNSAGNESKMVQTDDWVKFILDLPMVNQPSVSATYCSGGVILLGRIVEEASGMPLRQFADKYLFGPLGIENYQWNFKPDKSSSETFCQLYLRPRDMAKFGLLFANNGKWKNQQIISVDWIRKSTDKYSILDDSDYGYLWWHHWLNVRGKRFNATLATGNGGQKIHIWTRLNMITVLTGGNYNKQSPSNQILINHILPPFTKQ